MCFKSTQTGSALIISLMILLILSLLGLSAVQVSTVEEKMAGNLRDANLAFQAAEIALRDGENFMLSRTPEEYAALDFNCTNGLYLTGDFDCNGADATPIWDNANMNWSDDDLAVRYVGSGLPEKLARTPPAYIIERLAGVNNTLEVPAVLDTGYYRITARGTGGSDTAVAVVQSIYKR
ncbi:pilus assembly PilX family protein [Methylomagnum sp.]